GQDGAKKESGVVGEHPRICAESPGQARELSLVGYPYQGSVTGDSKRSRLAIQSRAFGTLRALRKPALLFPGWALDRKPSCLFRSGLFCLGGFFGAGRAFTSGATVGTGAARLSGVPSVPPFGVAPFGVAPFGVAFLGVSLLAVRLVTLFTTGFRTATA